MSRFSFSVLQQYIFRKPFGIHSPFLYAFSEKCIFNDHHHQAFDKLEELRKNLKLDERHIQVTDFGKGMRFGPKRKPGSSQPLQYQRPVRNIARKSLQDPAVCRLFYRMVQYFQPATILELGTSLGLTTSYLAMADGRSKVFTLEGCPQTADLARESFERAGVKNIEIITGDFRNNLPALLQRIPAPDMVYIDGDHSYKGVLANFALIGPTLHDKSVVIIDDIRWSAGMKAAWKHLAANEKTTLALDVGKAGILFFDPALSKQQVHIGF
ncbi:MAG: class I SAM-dependent methyltransferase [Bacteroidales bacterium]